MSMFREFQSSAKSIRSPGTVGLVVAIIVGFAICFLTPSVIQRTAFLTGQVFAQPWSFFTYAFTQDPRNFLGVLFSCLWLWGLGMTVEADLGLGKFLAVWLLFSFLCSLSLLLGAVMLHIPTGMMGAWTPIAALTVMWGTRYPNVEILFMFIIKVAAKWVAWISAGLVFFGVDHPMLAPFAALPLLLAYLYAADKIPGIRYGRSTFARQERETKVRTVGKQGARGDDAYFDDVRKREKEREERERLRKLFEGSIKDDEEK